MDQVQVTQFEQHLEHETLEIAMQVYEDICKEQIAAGKPGVPPEIDLLYNTFKEKWIDEMHTFLSANAEAYIMDPADFANRNDVEKSLAKYGFTVPSHTRFHAALHHYGISYLSHNKHVVNGAVVPVW